MIVLLLFYIVIKHELLLNNVKCTNMTAQMIVLLLLYIVIKHAWTILYLRFRQIKKRDLVHFVVACFVLCGLSVYGTAKLLSIVIRHGLLNT